MANSRSLSAVGTYLVSRLKRSTNPLSRHGSILLLIVSVALNLVQAQKLRALTDPVAARELVGTLAPALEVAALDKSVSRITFEGEATILYYFSPQCGWCERNWLNVKAVLAGTEGRYRFIGLSPSPDVGSYLRERRLTFQTYVISPDVARILDLGGTPHTVVVSAKGRIDHVWVGAYSPSLQRRVERALNVVLPGLPDQIARE